MVIVLIITILAVAAIYKAGKDFMNEFDKASEEIYKSLDDE